MVSTPLGSLARATGRPLYKIRRPAGTIEEIGGGFDVLDADDTPLCTLKGKWTGWDFHFLSNDGFEFAHVTKKWSGLGKEFFTSADNYIVDISETVEADNPIRMLILAAAVCIDMVLKE